MDTKRRKSRQILLEEKFHRKVLEAGRRHTVLDRRLFRRVSTLPPIVDTTISGLGRNRAKSIAMIKLPLCQESKSYGTVIHKSFPIKLPNINSERKISLQENENYWKPRSRRLSTKSQQLIIEHLRLNLLRQHEKRSLQYDEENKAVDAENNSEFSRDSNDEETAKWYQAMRSRGPSLSAMNFYSPVATTPSKQENMFENSMDSLRSFPSISQSPSPAFGSSRRHVQPINFNESQRQLPSSFPSARPSICVSFAPNASYDSDEVVKVANTDETINSNSALKKTSVLHKSISESEKSVNLLIQMAKRRSGLFEIPESDRERRSPTDQRSLTSTPVSPLRFQSRIGSARAMGNARTSKDDVYSDLPIDKISLFAEWRMQAELPERKQRSSAHSDAVDDYWTLDYGLSSRGSCCSAESRPVTAALAASCDESGVETDRVEYDGMTSSEELDIDDVDPRQRKTDLQKITLGNATIWTSKLKRKVCLYLSSNGDDTDMERRILQESSMSDLRWHCGEWNLDFFVIDFSFLSSKLRPSPNEHLPSWFKIDNKNLTSQLRRNAIKQCFAESVGPVFMSFFGETIDFEFPLPKRIPQFLFDGIIDLLKAELRFVDEKMEIARISFPKTIPDENKPKRLDKKDFVGRRHSIAISEASNEGETKLVKLQEQETKLKEDHLFLNSWYFLDTNTLPYFYELRKISCDFATFSASRRATSTADEKKKDQEKWMAVEEKLRRILITYTEPKMWKNTEFENAVVEWRKQAFKSVVESETALISTLPSWKTRETCYWFHRTLAEPDLLSSHLQKFLSNSSKLRDFTSKMKSKFAFSNICERVVRWSACERAHTSRDTNQQNRDWLMYVERLKTDFSSICKTLIDKAVAKYQIQTEDDLDEEIHQHVAFAQSLSKRYVDREEILNNIKTYLRSKRQRQPFVIYGPCGCGKSSVISQSLVRSKFWMEKKPRKFKNTDETVEDNALNCRVIFRSVGLTGDSSNIRLFLAGICAQLCRIANAIEKEEAANDYEKTSGFLSNLLEETSLVDLDFKELTDRFQILLRKCGRRKTPLLMFIDNLDAISVDNDGKQLKWLPDKLPHFVKLVVTITGQNFGRVTTKEKKRRSLSRTESLLHIKTTKSLSNRFTIAKTKSSECLATMKQRYGLDDASAVSIPELDSGAKAGLTALKAHSPHLRTIAVRMLQCEQIHLSEIQVSNLVKSCCFYPHPLAVAIGVAISREWTSQTTSQQCFESLPQRADSIEAFANCFLRHLESCHGRPFVAAVCSYITSSLNGLTSSELLTLLSYDKSVSKWLRDLSIESQLVNKNCQKSTGKKEETGSKNSNLPKRTGTNSSTNKQAKKIESYTKIAVPILLWQRLINDLSIFLIETLSDRRLTLRWRHVIFGSVCTKRYMSTNEVQSAYHQLMAHYFNNRIPTDNGETEEDLCQPLFWKRKKEIYPENKYQKEPPSQKESSTTNAIVFNFRRLNESFYHYFSCRSLDEIKEDLFCNFEWLLAKMRSSGFQSIIDALASVLVVHPSDKDLRLLAEALYLSCDVLAENPIELGGQLVGRLYNIIKRDKPLARMDPRKYPYCRQLIGQCRRSLHPALIPSGTCLSSPGDVLFDLLLGHRHVITAMTVTKDGQRAITASKDETIKVWDLFSGCVLSTMEKMPRHVVSLTACLGNNYVCIRDNTNKIQVISLLKTTCLLSLEKMEGRVVTAVSGDTSSFLVVFFDQLKEMKVWDLKSVRLLHKIDISPDGYYLREDQHLIASKASSGNNVFFSFHSTDQAYVYDAKRAKHLHTLKLLHDSGRAGITHVETSREYYVIACKRQYMRLHERVTFELYDSINYGHVRTLKACPEDKVFDICINRLGSHLIGLFHIDGGTVIGAWNVESGFHQHLESEKRFSSKGCCVDLQYCVTMSSETSTLRVHNLAARIDSKTMSRTHVKKKSSGIGEFYPVTSSSRYIVARGINSGPITVWNITRGRCKGEAVSIERGLHEKNDIIVVKDVMVIVLSDRGISSVEEGSHQTFTTIYVYDLCQKKYTRKLTKVAITVCPQHEYRILSFDKLLAVSPDRSHFQIWSLIDGKILNSVTPDFSKYVVSEAEARTSIDKKWKKGRAGVTKKNLSLVSLIDLAKKAPKSAKFRLSRSEQNKLIDQMLLSGDEGTLLCSFFGRHVAVFDMKTLTHTHTLTNKHSMLLLHQAEITQSGSHLVHTNYDNDAKVSYVTVWSLQHGKLVRRLRNEPYVCALTTSDKARKVVFATEDNYLKIWEPNRRGGHCTIPGYKGLRMRRRSNDCQGTTVYLTGSADRAVLFTYDISLWDLEAACVLTRFTPDVPFQCWTVAMNGHLIVAGMREQENVITLRLLSRDMDVTHYGRAALGENTGEFGEAQEKDSESSEDEIFSD